MSTEARFYPAIATPFAASDPMDGIDCALLARHAAELIERGATGVGLFGTTGEAASCALAERKDALERLLAAGIAPDRVLLGIGAAALGEAIELSRHGLGLGVRRQLMMPPFFYKNVDEAGLEACFVRLIETVGDARLALHLYHFPQASAVPIPFSVIERLLARHPTVVVGVKDSSGDPDHARKLIETFPTLDVYPAADELLRLGLEWGAAGSISAASNLGLDLGLEVAAARAEGEAARAADAQARLTALRRALTGAPLIAAVKAGLAARYGAPSFAALRPPLVPLGSARAAALLAQIEAARAAVS